MLCRFYFFPDFYFFKILSDVPLVISLIFCQVAIICWLVKPLSSY